METISLQQRHATEHRRAADSSDGDSSDYNEKHAKVHEKNVKKDKKLLKSRKGYAGS
jgi:hypothetical protein